MKKILAMMLMAFLYSSNLFANDETEKTMKEIRMGFKELKKSLREQKIEVSEELMDKFLVLVEKAEKIKLDERQEEYDKKFVDFKKSSEAMKILIKDKNFDEAKERINKVRKSCTACHREFMNPVKRFFLELSY